MVTSYYLCSIKLITHQIKNKPKMKTLKITASIVKRFINFLANGTELKEGSLYTVLPSNV